MDDKEQIARLKKRVIDLSIAFSNLEAERKYLRQRYELLCELADRIKAVAVPYAGQDNKYEPSPKILAFIDTERHA